MADEKKGKTYKLKPETISKLQEISDVTGLNWDDTFILLSNLFAQDQAAKALPGRETEIKNFQAHINALSTAFSQALQINADTDARIRDEFAARLASNEEAMSSLKEKLQITQDAVKDAEAEKQVLQDEAEKVTKDAEVKITELNKQVESLNAQVTMQADAIRDKDRINASLTDQIAELQAQTKQATAEKEQAVETAEKAKREQDDLNEQIVKMTKRAEAAEAAIANQKAVDALALREAVVAAREEEQQKHQQQMDDLMKHNEQRVDALNAKISELYEKLEAKGKKRKPRTKEEPQQEK